MQNIQFQKLELPNRITTRRAERWRHHLLADRPCQRQKCRRPVVAAVVRRHSPPLLSVVVNNCEAVGVLIAWTDSIVVRAQPRFPPNQHGRWS